MTEILLANSGFVALVDDEDADFVGQSAWYVLKTPWNTYASSPRRTSQHKLLHRLIMNPKDNLVVHHKNGNGLDNRKANLVVVTQRDNLLARPVPAGHKTGVRGVSWMESRKKYRARIGGHRWEVHLGLFNTLEEAIVAIQRSKNIEEIV